jgi:hypothetical protein
MIVVVANKLDGSENQAKLVILLALALQLSAVLRGARDLLLRPESPPERFNLSVGVNSDVPETSFNLAGSCRHRCRLCKSTRTRH